MVGVLRLVVAEDNLLVREGLVSLLVAAGDLVPTTVCSTLDELYEAVERDEPDVVVTDIRMPPNHRDEGIQAARRFRATRPELGVVVLSQFVDPAYALALLDDGTRGRGYVLKDRVDEVDRLAQAIRVVAAGGSFIDDEVVDALVRARTRMVDSPLLPSRRVSSTCWQRWRPGPPMPQSPSRSVSARTPSRSTARRSSSSSASTALPTSTVG